MSTPGPYKPRRIAIADPRVDVQVRQAVNDLAQHADLNEVWAQPDTDLNNVCNVAGTTVVRLYANTTYNVGALVLTQPVEIIASASTVIQPAYGFTGTPKCTVNVASGALLIIRGGHWKMPIECLSRAWLDGLQVDTTHGTSHGYKVELNAARCCVSACWSDRVDLPGTVGIGIYSGSSKCRAFGNDFSGYPVALRYYAADNIAAAANAGTTLVI